MSRVRLHILLLALAVMSGLCPRGAVADDGASVSSDPAAGDGAATRTSGGDSTGTRTAAGDTAGGRGTPVVIDTLSAGGIDSVVALPSWDPRDPEANLPLIPHALITDPLGRAWVLDRSRSRVARLGADGGGRSLSVGNRDGFPAPVADLAASGSFLYLLEPGDESIALLDLDGFFRERVDLRPEIERAGYRGFLPSRILVSPSGDLWLLEPRGARLLRFDRRGRFIDAPLESMAGSERPRRIADAALTPDGDLLLLDSARSGIVVIGATGTPQSFEPLDGPIAEPATIACDATGLRVVFEGNGRLRIIQPGGTSAWEGRVGAWPDGPHRACIIDRDVLCAADAARGTIHRWRIARRGPEDAQD